VDQTKPNFLIRILGWMIKDFIVTSLKEFFKSHKLEAR